MLEVEERESLLRSLKGYLADLVESGVDELPFAEEPVPELECRLDGNPRARLLFVMTGPGFAGEAGALLEKIISAMGFSREEVSLLSLGHCPDGARDSWRRSLAERVAEARPEVVVSLGEESTGLLLGSDQPLQRVRGRFHQFQEIPLMPSHHPDAMLADQGLKRDVWSDMQQVMRRLGQAR